MDKITKSRNLTITKLVIRICLIFLPVLLIGGLVFGYFYWYNLPINQIERAFEDKDYKLVVELYDDLTKSDEQDSVKKRLINIAGEYYDDYYEENITYEEVQDYLDLISKDILKRNRHIRKYKHNIEEIYQSRKDYALAVEYMEETEYILAMEYFGLVSDLDEEYKEAAEEYIEECYECFCQNVIEEADEKITLSEYEEAKSIVLDAILIFPDEQIFIDKLAEIQVYLDVDISNSYSATYDLGELIASELGVSGYDVYFPAELVFEFSEDTLKIYISEDSIESALIALTDDSQSMEALYAVASDYGINKTEADILISIVYGGSYAEFILDNFSSDIDYALSMFSYEVSYFAGPDEIYIGSQGRNEDNYISYEEYDNYIVLESYTGNNEVLLLLEYPLTLYK